MPPIANWPKCEANGLTIVRKLIGPYITSLEMQGFSIHAAQGG